MNTPDASLTEMRDLWKHFDLNRSPGAAMRITYADGEVKSHGTLQTPKLEFIAMPWSVKK